MLCHGRDTIVARMWHNSFTAVTRPSHDCATTYFSKVILYFFEGGPIIFAEITTANGGDSMQYQKGLSRGSSLAPSFSPFRHYISFFLFFF